MPRMLGCSSLSGLLGLMVVVLGLAGCGDDRPSGMPELHLITLEFTQAGSPLSDAAVQLIPMDSGNTWTSGGATDNAGKCSVLTHGTYAGVPTGKYKVCVSKTETQGEAGGEIDMSNPGKPTASTLKTFSLVDPKYSVQATTPLEIEVTGSEATLGPFDLGEPTRTEVQRPPS